MSGAGQKRKLATILAADVVGYSKLMAEDEEGTIRNLKSHREIFDKFIERHDGRIFNTGGDSVLAEFGSTVEAVRCAMSIQDELRVRNSAMVPERQMRFRIGINVGDVLVDGTDLLGDGVNVAARLEGLAEPGGICISGSAFEQVKNKLSVGFADLGPQQVKNIPDPVSAYGVTSSPVTVQSATDKGAEAPVARSGRRLVLLAGAGLAAAALIGIIGVFGMRYLDNEATALSAFPGNVSTDQLRASEVAAFMTGMTMQGTRAVDGQPFTIVFNRGGTLDYKFGRTGNLSGTTGRATGAWRTEDYRFCMQVRGFSKGREICPRVVRDGQRIFMTRRDGRVMDWTLSK